MILKFALPRYFEALISSVRHDTASWHNTTTLLYITTCVARNILSFKKSTMEKEALVDLEAKRE
jgi:hypothetical protein